MNKAADTARDPAPAEPVLEIRFGQVGLAQARIRTTDPGTLLDELSGRIATAPQFFERAPVCLDLGALEQEPTVEDARRILDAIHRAGMLPVGLAHGTEGIDILARALGLPLLTQFRAQARTPATVRVKEASTATSSPAAVPEVPEFPTPTLMHHRPVRSGQRIYARHRDLVVTAAVGAGAEVISDGCVHVYGSLRGRAIAGARGEITARVFCQEFNAELVSIAGVFRVFETIPPELAGRPVQAWLDGDDLRFAGMGG